MLTDNYLSNDTGNSFLPIEQYIGQHFTDISIYIRENTHYTVRATTLPEAKTAVVEIKIYENKNKNKLLHTVITTYRRPTTQEKDNFIMEIQDEIENSQQKHTKTPVTLVLVGDTNIDILAKQTKYT